MYRHTDLSLLAVKVKELQCWVSPLMEEEDQEIKKKAEPLPSWVKQR